MEQEMDEVKPIPINTLLNIVVIVGNKNVPVQTLFKAINNEGYEIEITPSYERAVFAVADAYSMIIDDHDGELVI